MVCPSVASQNTLQTCDCPTGDIVYTRVLGQDIVILNSKEVAIELLEKRSQKYSDRPVISIADMYVFFRASPGVHFTLTGVQTKVRHGMDDNHRTVRAEVQVTSTTPT